MFIVGVSSPFIATHQLEGDVPEMEKTPHSHNYELRWEIAVDHLDEQGFGINIAHMEGVIAQVIPLVNKTFLNDEPFFQDKQTSIENLSIYLLQQLNHGLEAYGYDPLEYLYSQLTIYENDHAWATYRHE
jgi:6-pyruvoyltetrahydropterin/6-carboxytetrahydropterin synthase